MRAASTRGFLKTCSGFLTPARSGALSVSFPCPVRPESNDRISKNAQPIPFPIVFLPFPTGSRERRGRSRRIAASRIGRPATGGRFFHQEVVPLFHGESD